MRWNQSASTGELIINTTVKISGLILSSHSSNQVYLSSEQANQVYLWTFGATSPSLTFFNILSSLTDLVSPRGIALDPYWNLYAAEKADTYRVIMYCYNTTDGKIVINSTSNPSSWNKPGGIAFDSQLNMYLALESKAVVKHDLL